MKNQSHSTFDKIVKKPYSVYIQQPMTTPIR